VASAPQPTYRLIPSQFPPIGLFDTVSTAADLQAVMDLAGWTNDRLVAHRAARLPRSKWVYGRANASIVMASFLHVAPGGSRFNGPDLGAWYASESPRTAIAEVGHHLRREAVSRLLPGQSRTFRVYSAKLVGNYVDIRGEATASPALYDPTSYAASQIFGEQHRAAGLPGILYDSVRHLGGTNVVAYDPPNILDVTQADHFDIVVSVDHGKIEARRLSR
jgi:RES domain-containing protein